MEVVYSHGDIVLGVDGKQWVIDRLTLVGESAGYEAWSYYDAVSTDFQTYKLLDPKDVVKYLGRADMAKFDEELERLSCI